MGALQHIRIPSAAPQYPTYAYATSLQSELQARFLYYKASLSSPSPTQAPPPSLISFTPAPTYAFGRRQVDPLSAREAARLRAPLRVRHHEPDAETGAPSPRWRTYTPEVVNAPRGGLATYHGPGQIVFWPVIDLHSPYHFHFTVRNYTSLLERTTIAALNRVTARTRAGKPLRPIRGFKTDNPGVWVQHSSAGLWTPTPDDLEEEEDVEAEGVVGESAEGDGLEGEGEERKISALGVHIRRHITGLGVAINVNMPVAGPEAINPWGRIMACGLEDKGVTSMEAELAGRSRHPLLGTQLQEELRAVWADEFEQRLGIKTSDTMAWWGPAHPFGSQSKHSRVAAGYEAGAPAGPQAAPGGISGSDSGSIFDGIDDIPIDF